MDGSQPLDPRKTIFVGGVPRPLRAGKYKIGIVMWPFLKVILLSVIESYILCKIYAQEYRDDRLSVLPSNISLYLYCLSVSFLHRLWP